MDRETQHRIAKIEYRIRQIDIGFDRHMRARSAFYDQFDMIYKRLKSQQHQVEILQLEMEKLLDAYFEIFPDRLARDAAALRQIEAFMTGKLRDRDKDA